MRKLAFKAGFHRPLDPEAKKQYMAVHPDAASRAGVAVFPEMVPDKPGHPEYEAIKKVGETLKTWDVPMLVMFSDKDFAFKPAEGRQIAAHAPNGRFKLIRNAGHFLQEDAGEEIATEVAEFLSAEVWKAA